MKNILMRPPLRGALAAVLALCLLLGGAALGAEAPAEEESAGKALWIGFNAGYSNGTESADVNAQAAHRQVTALLRLLLMLEERDHPAVQISYAGVRQNPLDTRSFSRADLAALDALDAEPYRYTKGSDIGAELLSFLRARAEDMPKQGKAALYWFDRLTPPDLGRVNGSQMTAALTSILENPETEIYLAFAKDNEGRLAAFEAQVLSGLAGRERVHVTLYGEETLSASLRQLSDQQLTALYMGDLARAGDQARAALFSFAPEGPQTEDCLLWVRSASELRGIELQSESGEPVTYETVALGTEAAVFLPAQGQTEQYTLTAVGDAPADITAAAYLLPAWQPALTVEREDGAEDALALYQETSSLALSVRTPGLPQEQVHVTAEVTYRRVERPMTVRERLAAEAAAADAADENSDAPAELPLSLSEATGLQADGSLGWDVLLPPLEVGEGEVRFTLWLNEPEKSIVKNMDGGVLAQTEPMAFTVSNRQPLSRAAVVEDDVYTVYTPVPGLESIPVVLTLSNDLYDYDKEQSLEYGLIIDGQWTEQTELLSIQGDQLTILPAQEAAEEEVTVRAVDPYGAGAEITLRVQWALIQDALDGMRFELTEEKTGQVGRDTELEWRLPGAETAVYRQAQAQYPLLPDLAEALTVEAQEGVSFDPFRWEGEDVVLRAVLSASTKNSTVEVRPQASLTVGEERLPLPGLFADGARVTTSNTSPALADAVDPHPEAQSGYVMDVPLMEQKPLALSVNGENEFVLTDFFTDAETQPADLAYLILTDSEDVALRSGEEEILPAEAEEISLPAGREGWRCWALPGDGRALRLEMTAPGAAQIELRAADGEFISEPIALQAEAQSYLRHLLVLGGLILAGAAVAVGALLILRRARKPSFQRVNMQIVHKPYSSIKGTLDLSCYGKKNVDFMTLMAAAGMPPVGSLNSEALSNIELKPLRQDEFRILFKAGAESQARIEMGGRESRKHSAFGLNQQVSILSAEGNEGIVICLTKQA